MTIPKREQLANNAFSQLDGSIDASQTTLDVADGSSFPAVGNFRVTISDEIMVCTARSSNTLTVARGQEGTTPATHDDGSNITHNLTAGGLTRWAQDNDALWGYSGAPPLGRIDNGSGTVLTSADFTWVNQGGATVSDQNGTMFLRAPPSAGNNLRILKRTAASPPYSVIGAFEIIKFQESEESGGLLFRKNSDGKAHLFAIGPNGSSPFVIAVDNFTSNTNYVGSPLARRNCLFVGRYFWQKIEDDGTNLKFYAGFDGVEWIQAASFSRTVFMSGGPDEIGWYGNSTGSLYELGVRLAHFSVS
jgi:hypothetical protein